MPGQTLIVSAPDAEEVVSNLPRRCAMAVSGVSGGGALAIFTQTLQQLKSQVQNSPMPRMPELPPPSPVSQANKNLGRMVDMKM
jgi:hypothetical protein